MIGREEESKENLSRVVILGSPNVGKSTLYNRLLGRRRTITDPTPGVTRDSVESGCQAEGILFNLVDTGGYRIDRIEGSEELTRIISSKSLQAGQTADLILFVVDVNRLSGNDMAIIEVLRPISAKVILVINKVDNSDREILAWNFLNIGFKRMVAVSATHGRNIEKLKSEIHDFLLANRLAEEKLVNTPAETTITIAVLGKPNTGKSSLVNHLLGEEKSIVSETPGTTRDVIDGYFRFANTRFRILDTAGIRRKTKVRDKIEYYSVHQALVSIKSCDIVLLLVDAVLGLSDQDKKIASLVVREGKGIILVLNKWDLLDPVENRSQAVRDRIAYLFPVLKFAPVVPLSAQTGYGIKKMLETALTVIKQLNKRIATSTLNQALVKLIENFPPPSRGKNIKIRYATQVSSNPVVFLFFVNSLKSFPRQYSKYLANRIQNSLGFNHVPVRIEFRE